MIAGAPSDYRNCCHHGRRGFDRFLSQSALATRCVLVPVDSVDHYLEAFSCCSDLRSACCLSKVAQPSFSDDSSSTKVRQRLHKKWQCICPTPQALGWQLIVAAYEQRQCPQLHMQELFQHLRQRMLVLRQECNESNSREWLAMYSMF